MFFAVPSSSSFAASLSCQPLHSLRLHYISGVRSTHHLSFHFAFIHFSSFNSPTAAYCFGSPAGRFGLRSCHSFCISKLHALSQAITYAIIPTHKTKTPPATCVFNIGRNRPHFATLHSVLLLLPPLLHSLAARCTMSANLFVTLHYLQPFSLRWLMAVLPALSFFPTHS